MEHPIIRKVEDNRVQQYRIEVPVPLVIPPLCPQPGAEQFLSYPSSGDQNFYSTVESHSGREVLTWSLHLAGVGYRRGVPSRKGTTGLSCDNDCFLDGHWGQLYTTLYQAYRTAHSLLRQRVTSI